MSFGRESELGFDANLEGSEGLMSDLENLRVKLRIVSRMVFNGQRDSETS